MVLRLSVSHSVHGGVYTSLGRHPPRQTLIPPWADPPPPGRHPPDGNRGGRYASCWNAFLFYLSRLCCNILFCEQPRSLYAGAHCLHYEPPHDFVSITCSRSYTFAFHFSVVHYVAGILNTERHAKPPHHIPRNVTSCFTNTSLQLALRLVWGRVDGRQLSQTTISIHSHLFSRPHNNGIRCKITQVMYCWTVHN